MFWRKPKPCPECERLREKLGQAETKIAVQAARIAQLEPLETEKKAMQRAKRLVSVIQSPDATKRERRDARGELANLAPPLLQGRTKVTLLLPQPPTLAPKSRK